MVADELLLERVAQGDRGEAMEQLYDRYARRIYAFGRRLLPDRGMAEELVQETFVRLWRSAPSYDPRVGSVRTFLYTIARRAAIDLHRRTASRAVPAEASEVERHAATGSGEGDDIERLLVSLELQDAVAALPPAHGEVIRLAFVHDLSQRQISQRLGVPVGTVKSRTYHALRALRARLEESEAHA